MNEKRISLQPGFDELMIMARQQPEAFEQKRLQLIEALIASQPVDRQQNLRRLQWRIDQENRKSSSSMGRCVRLSEMMWERFNVMRAQLELVCDIYDGKVSAPAVDDKSRVVPLKTASA